MKVSNQPSQGQWEQDAVVAARPETAADAGADVVDGLQFPSFGHGLRTLCGGIAATEAVDPSATGRHTERRRYLEVAEAILRAVTEGTLTAGDRLPDERTLAERCGASRSTVREALFALELNGVVESRAGSGCFLTSESIDSVSLPARRAGNSPPKELLEARQIVEPSVARLFAGRARPLAVTKLRWLLEEADRQVSASSPEALSHFMALGLAFHEELARSCGNSLVAAVAGDLVGVGRHPLWTLVDSMVERSAEARTTQVHEHRAILDAVVQGRPAAAEDAMAAHLGALSCRLFDVAPIGPRITHTRRRGRREMRTTPTTHPNRKQGVPDA